MQVMSEIVAAENDFIHAQWSVTLTFIVTDLFRILPLLWLSSIPYHNCCH